MAVTGIVLTILYDFMRQAWQMQTFISEQSQAISEAQEGAELFTKELRESTAADTGAYSIVQAEENSLTFYSDIDADIATERVHYFLDGTNFIRGVLEPSGDPLTYSGTETETIISASVVNDSDTPIFTYYDENYPSTTTPLTYPADVTSITLAKIDLEVNVNPERVPDTFTLETFVQLRNLKDNL